MYWTTTTLLSLFLLWSAYSYLFDAGTAVGVRELGFPDFFRVQLAILKIVAVGVIVVPQVPPVAKDWAYAGVGLFLVTAIVAHVAHRDPVIITLVNVAIFGLLVASRMLLQKG